MKFFPVATLVVVLAVAHGTEALSVVKQQDHSMKDYLNHSHTNIIKLISDMNASITKATNDMVEKVKAHVLANTAHTYVNHSSAKIHHLIEKLQAEAIKLQQQVKPFFANIEDHIKPLTDNFIAHANHLTDNFQEQVEPVANLFESLFQEVMDQTESLPSSY